MPPVSNLVSLTKIAEEQHGVIGRAQALANEISADALGRLVRAGAWTRLYPRVYSIFTPLNPDARRRQMLFAAAMWLGARAAVSHRPAAWLLDLDGVDTPPIELSSTSPPRPREGLIVHDVSVLTDADVTLRQGIRVTSVARTLIDLGAVAPPHVVELALESALRRGRVSLQDLNRRLDCAANKHGTAALRSLLATPKIATESALESLVAQLLRAAHLPDPVRQHEVISREGRFVARVDFAYPAEQIAIEADGFRYHSSSREWARDLARQNAMMELGWIVLRVTWSDVIRRGPAVADRVKRLLLTRSSPQARHFLR